MKKTLLLLLVTSAFALSGCDRFMGGDEEPAQTAQEPAATPATPAAPAAPMASAKVCFGVYTAENVQTIFKKFTPVRTYLQDYMRDKGQRVTIENKIYHGYSEAIDALADGDCDFFRFGPASYILAHRKNPDIQLIAIELNDGAKRFNGVIAAHKDSPINTLEDLKGATFAFGNENSTIGRYLSQAALVKAGIHANDLEDLEYLGRHDWVGRAVSEGSYEAGALKEGTFNKYPDLKVVVKFPNVTKPWVARSGLDSTILAGLRDGLLNLKDEAILKALKVSGFEATSDDDFDFVRKGMEMADQF